VLVDNIPIGVRTDFWRAAKPLFPLYHILAPACQVVFFDQSRVFDRKFR
jgi:hypothetical protein